MQLIMLKSKIHQAVVTDSQLEYEGSLTIDRLLMDAAGILDHEKIMVADLENGERFETYAIPAEPGSGTICLNGATAHRGKIGDRIIIFTFCVMSPDEARRHKPTIIHPDRNNRLRG